MDTWLIGATGNAGRAFLLGSRLAENEASVRLGVSQAVGAACPLKRRVRWAEKRGEPPVGQTADACAQPKRRVRWAEKRGEAPVSQDAGAACPLKRRVRWAEKRDEIPPCIFRKTGYNIKVCQRSRRWGRRRTSTLQRAGAWCKSGREEPHADHPGVRRPEISQGCPGAPDTEPQEDSCTEGTAWLSTWVVPRI